MNQFKIVGSVGLIFFLNAFPSLALSQSIIHESNPSSRRSTGLAQTQQENSELVNRVSTNLGLNCGEVATKKGYTQQQARLMMACIDMFRYSLTSLKNGTIKVPSLDDLKPTKAVKVIADLLGADKQVNKKIMVGHKFIRKNLGEKDAGKLTYIILYAVAANFLQEDRGVNMEL